MECIHGVNCYRLVRSFSIIIYVKEMFPEAFIRQMRQSIGDSSWAALSAALGQPAPVSIRLNRHRQPDNVALLPEQDGQVPWHPDGYYLAERPVFTLDPLFHAGAYYVQEASSMFIYEVLRQTGRLGRTGLRVLDLCAAPGGKTTLLYDALGGQLTANEVVPQRAGILRENLERWGALDVAVLSGQVEQFVDLPVQYDVVLVDAPCSGEGMFRKDPASIGEWSSEQVFVCARRQKGILDAVESLLAPGGLLIYSTCTYNRAENDDNFLSFCALHSFSPIRLLIPEDWGVVETESGYQFYPHLVRGEGFFVAACEKPGNSVVSSPTGVGFRQLVPLPKRQRGLLEGWLDRPEELAFWQTPSGEILTFPIAQEPYLKSIDPFFSAKWFGCPIGQIKGSDFIPSHSLALSFYVNKQIPRVALDREQALIFLKKENPVVEQAPRGWVLATYAGLSLGWMKVLPNRINNYLPNDRRIRMRLD